MAESVVERVARAIGAIRCQITKSQQPILPSDMVYARAAIEAMREPTEEMMEAFYDGAYEARDAALNKRAKSSEERAALGLEPLYKFPYGISPGEWFPDGYRAMIDAALSESP